MTTPLTYAVRRLVGRSYLLSTAQQHLRSLTAPVYRSNPLIVYQMGKVGSEALEASLQHADLGRPLYRVHAMRRRNIVEGLRAANTTPRRYFKRSKVDFYGYHLGREIRRDLHKHQWQVITMVRDPVAQNVSSFFQIVDLLIPGFADRLARDDVSLDELVALFVQHYPPDNIFVRWFEEELGRVFDVDVFAGTFPWEQGWDRVRRPHLDLLIIRLEDFDRVAVPAVSRFLGIPGFELRRRNEASQKGYSRLYDRFRTEAVLPRDYVDGVYESAMARHFYSPEERERFRARLNVGP